MADKPLFSELIGEDIAPIKTKQRVTIKSHRSEPDTLAQRRAAAEAETATVDDPLAGEPMEMVEPLSVLSFQRPGMQHGVFRNLRLGKYSIDARLDLHNLTVDAARREVYQFVRDCLSNDVRTALITHGMGQGRAQPARLKSCVAFWLPQMNEVLAFHTAMKHHGSYGATYVLLRKSDRKKRETHELHSRR